MNRLRHYRAQARLAWHVFRGRPLAYRLGVEGGLVIGPRTWVDQCDIRLGGHATAAIDVMPGATGCLITNNVGSCVTSFQPPRTDAPPAAASWNTTRVCGPPFGHFDWGAFDTGNREVP